MPNETLAPQTPILSSKTLEKFFKTCGPELGTFEPLASRRVLDQRRHHRPSTCNTRQSGKCATSGRSCRPNFPASRCRTCPDLAGEAAVAVATVGHRTFLDFLAISGHFRLTYTSLPPFLDPLHSFPWSLFADFSPFESYDENKVGRRLDRVFRPPQQLLDQGNGTDEFLVSWAFH